eukprot:TRINITY_DN32763_c0_g1_i1.p1 TRINITY_DN32763_c0_g1~~TRINITY_DN32763_c0_g1_i1.p1  ORF type:complete len:351 (+),score=75.92 TRINITY_DN32763_c0_g1_i1:50-1102(+)
MADGSLLLLCSCSYSGREEVEDLRWEFRVGPPARSPTAALAAAAPTRRGSAAAQRPRRGDEPCVGRVAGSQSVGASGCAAAGGRTAGIAVSAGGEDARYSSDATAVAAPTDASVILAPSACDWCGSGARCGCEAQLLLWAEAANPQSESPKTLDGDMDDTASTDLADESSSRGEDVSHGCASSASSEPDAADAADTASDPVEGKQPQPSLPDFTGTWVLSHIEGDMEALMLDAGVGWTVRKLARGANYGVGVLAQQIRHHDDDLDVDFRTGIGTYRLVVKIGGGLQDTIYEDGRPVKLLPHWMGSKLVLEGTGKDGSYLQTRSVYMVEQDMVNETRTSDGLVVKRFFTRK